MSVCLVLHITHKQNTSRLYKELHGLSIENQKFLRESHRLYELKNKFVCIPKADIEISKDEKFVRKYFEMLKNLDTCEKSLFSMYVEIVQLEALK